MSPVSFRSAIVGCLVGGGVAIGFVLPLFPGMHTAQILIGVWLAAGGMAIGWVGSVLFESIAADRRNSQARFKPSVEVPPPGSWHTISRSLDDQRRGSA